MFPTGAFGGPTGSRLSLGNVGPLSFGNSTARQNPNVALRQIGSAVLGLRRGLEGVSSALDGVTRTTISEDGAVAFSRSGLSLSTIASSTKLTSGEDVSTVATSIPNREPGWASSSTSDVTLSGVYDGSLGDETLILEVTRGGDVGQDFLFYRVLDSQGNELGQRALRPVFQPGDDAKLMFGLRIELGEGNLQQGDRLRINVKSSVDTDLRPNKPFNGTGNESALLDPDREVRDGSLRINGQVVEVSASDSLNQVLQRINAQVNGVRAEYDPTTERVLLERTQPGPAPLALTGDTSGFVTAMKLESAQPKIGSRDEVRSPLAQVPKFNGVGAGSFEINGEVISLNPGQDSLEELLERISNQVPDVTASYDKGLGRVEIRNETGDLELGEDTTGFFQTLGIEEGFYTDNRTGGEIQTVVPDEAALRLELETLAESLSSVFRLSFSGVAGARATGAQGQLRNALEGALKDFGFVIDGDSVRTDYGLKIDFKRVEGEVVRFDDGLLEQSLRSDAGSVIELLLGRPGDEGKRGLMERMEGITNSLSNSLAGSLSGDSLAVDLLS